MMMMDTVSLGPLQLLMMMISNAVSLGPLQLLVMMMMMMMISDSVSLGPLVYCFMFACCIAHKQVENVAGSESLAAEHLASNYGMYLLNELAGDIVNAACVVVSAYVIACLYYLYIVHKIIM